MANDDDIKDGDVFTVENLETGKTGMVKAEANKDGRGGGKLKTVKGGNSSN